MQPQTRESWRIAAIVACVAAAGFIGSALAQPHVWNRATRLIGFGDAS